MQIILQGAGCDDESPALLRPLFLLSATLIKKVLKDAEIDFGLVDARRCSFDGHHLFIYILKAFKHLAIGTFVHDHVGALERNLLPTNKRVRIHARPVVLQNLTAAIPQRRMPYSAAELTTPRFSCQKDTFLDEHLPASMRCKSHVAIEDREQHLRGTLPVAPAIRSRQTFEKLHSLSKPSQSLFSAVTLLLLTGFLHLPHGLQAI